MITCVVLALISLLFIGLGCLIWYFKIASIIAGYDATKITNPDALAKWIGKCMIATGLSALAISLIRLLVDGGEKADLFAFMGFMIGSMTSMVVTLAGTQRYNK